MFSIDYDKLHELEDAFIMYEISEHMVNPKETLEGTELRINKSEGYKKDIFDKYHAQVLEGPPYVQTIMSAFPGHNLASYHQKTDLEKVVETDGEAFEIALESLYEGSDDESAFNNIVDVVGVYFDILGLFFF